jgi:hypothetical protein
MGQILHGSARTTGAVRLAAVDAGHRAQYGGVARLDPIEARRLRPQPLGHVLGLETGPIDRDQALEQHSTRRRRQAPENLRPQRRRAIILRERRGMGLGGPILCPIPVFFRHFARSRRLNRVCRGFSPSEANSKGIQTDA